VHHRLAFTARLGSGVEGPALPRFQPSPRGWPVGLEPSGLGRLSLGWQPTVKNKGGRGALAADARRWWPGHCRRPGGKDRWGRRLEGYDETVNQLEGFIEEGAHRIELSTGA
jgi:hypothetical protein